MEYRTYTIKLNSFDVGLLLDGIEQRALSYRNTLHYHAFGHTLSDDIVEKVTDADEARQIAEHYESIIAAVRAQTEQQDKER